MATKRVRKQAAKKAWQTMREEYPKVSVRYTRMAGRCVRVTVDFKTRFITFRPLGKPEIKLKLDNVFNLLSDLVQAGENLRKAAER